MFSRKVKTVLGILGMPESDFAVVDKNHSGHPGPIIFIMVKLAISVIQSVDPEDAAEDLNNFASGQVSVEKLLEAVRGLSSEDLERLRRAML